MEKIRDGTRKGCDWSTRLSALEAACVLVEKAGMSEKESEGGAGDGGGGGAVNARGVAKRAAALSAVIKVRSVGNGCHEMPLLSWTRVSWITTDDDGCRATNACTMKQTMAERIIPPFSPAKVSMPYLCVRSCVRVLCKWCVCLSHNLNPPPAPPPILPSLPLSPSLPPRSLRAPCRALVRHCCNPFLCSSFA